MITKGCFGGYAGGYDGDVSEMRGRVKTVKAKDDGARQYSKDVGFFSTRLLRTGQLVEPTFAKELVCGSKFLVKVRQRDLQNVVGGQAALDRTAATEVFKAM